MFLILGAEISVYTPDSRDYIIVQNLTKSISDRYIHFKVKTCKNAYIGLISGNTDSDPLYEIGIGDLSKLIFISYIRFGRENSSPIISVSTNSYLQCNSYTDFVIIWNNHAITVGVYRNSDWYELLPWTSTINLWPILNVGICTKYGSGQWQFFTQGMKSNCLI